MKIDLYNLVVNKADTNRFSDPYWKVQSPFFYAQPSASRRAVLENGGCISQYGPETKVVAETGRQSTAYPEDDYACKARGFEVYKQQISTEHQNGGNKASISWNLTESQKIENYSSFIVTKNILYKCEGIISIIESKSMTR